MLVDTTQTFFASLRSIGTAAVMACAGIYLHRKRIIIGEEKRKLALLSKKVTLPAFFFSKIMYCDQNWSHEPCPNVTDNLRDVWMLFFWPLYVVGCGFLLAWFVTTFFETPMAQRKSVFAAIAFANSTGLPITLLTVIHSSFPTTSELGRVDPTLFLSVYLLLYPVLQWGVGGYLLTDDDDEEEPQVITKSDIVRVLSDKVLHKLDAMGSEMNVGSKKDSIDHDARRYISDYDLEKAEAELVALTKDTVCKSYTTSINRNDSGEEADATCSTTAYSETYVSNQPHDSDSESNHDGPSCMEKITTVASKCLTPPVQGALLGVVVTSTPLRGLFIDLVNRADKAPLEWFYDGIYHVGQAAIPLNMMILGMNLSSSQHVTDRSKLLPMSTMIGIVVGKLIAMPIIGIASAVILKNYFWNVPEEINATFYLVSMIVFITPTADDVMVMVELSGSASKEGIARVFGLEYLCAPLLLTLSVTVVVGVASQWA